MEGLGLRLLCGPGESVRVQGPKQNIKHIISDIGVFCGLILFFGHWYRTIEVINVKRYTPSPKKNITENKKKTKGTSKTARTNQTFAAMKVPEGNTSIRTPHGNNRKPKCNIFDKKRENNSTKTLVFPCFFWQPWKRGRNLGGYFFGGEQKNQGTEKKENGPKIKNAKNGKRYFALIFWCLQKEELISRPGGGGFLDTALSTVLFLDPLFWGSIFKGRVNANEITLQK